MRLPLAVATALLGVAVAATPAAAALPQVTPAASTRSAEGDAGTTTVRVRVTLSRKARTRVTVRYATAVGTAGTADFVARSGSVRIARGKRSATIALQVRGDTADEPDERFSVRLSSPRGARLGARRSGTVTIADDDAAPASPPTPAPVVPAAYVQDLVRSEAPSGTAEVVVTLSTTTTRAVSVAYATGDGTATSSGGAPDFTSVFGTLTIPAGEARGVISVPVADDPRDEDTQTFTVSLASPDGVTLADPAGTVALIDDDPTPSLSIDDVSVLEANTTAMFTVSLSSPSDASVTVKVSTGGGTLTGSAGCNPGSDYVTLNNKPVTFSPGETAQTVAVTACEDAVDENNETTSLTLTEPVAATLADAAGLLTILDDD